MKPLDAKIVDGPMYFQIPIPERATKVYLASPEDIFEMVDLSAFGSPWELADNESIVITIKRGGASMRLERKKPEGPQRFAHPWLR